MLKHRCNREVGLKKKKKKKAVPLECCQPLENRDVAFHWLAVKHALRHYFQIRVYSPLYLSRKLEQWFRISYFCLFGMTSI